MEGKGSEGRGMEGRVDKTKSGRPPTKFHAAAIANANVSVFNSSSAARKEKPHTEGHGNGTWFSCTKAITRPSSSGLQKGFNPSGISATSPAPSAGPGPARGGKPGVVATTPVLCKGRTHLRHRTAVPFCSLLRVSRGPVNQM